MNEQDVIDATQELWGLTVMGPITRLPYLLSEEVYVFKDNGGDVDLQPGTQVRIIRSCKKHLGVAYYADYTSPAPGKVFVWRVGDIYNVRGYEAFEKDLELIVQPAILG